jgi:hypothetical protein
MLENKDVVLNVKSTTPPQLQNFSPLKTVL